MNHDPTTRARQWWESTNPSFPWWEAVDRYRELGLVYLAQDAAVLARPWELGTDLWRPSSDPDTWFLLVAATAGETCLHRFFELAPYRLDLVSFHRNNRLRVYDYDRLKILSQKLWEQK